MGIMIITINSNNKEDYIKSLNGSLDSFISTYENDTNNKRYSDYVPLAKHLKNNLNNICLHIHNSCYDSSNIGQQVSSFDMVRSLSSYRFYCYGKRISDFHINFQSLEQQNENVRNYVNYDFGIQTLESI